MDLTYLRRSQQTQIKPYRNLINLIELTKENNIENKQTKKKQMLQKPTDFPFTLKVAILSIKSF